METIDAQNQIARMNKTILLNAKKETPRMKKQFVKVTKLILDLHYALDLLNDMKDGE